MKRIFILWAALLLTFSLSAQQTKHIVQRGETFGSIARKYAVSESDLRKWNPYFKDIYAGMQLYLPDSRSKGTLPPASTTNSHSGSSRIAEAYMENARGYYRDKKYAKAIKEIEKALTEQPSVEAYLLRGKCYLMRDKYEKACNDFAVVMDSPNATRSQVQEASSWNQSSARMWEEKAAKRAQFWGGIAADAIAIAQDMTQQKMLENQMVAQAGSATKDKEFNKSLQKIYRQAGKNMRKEQLNDYMSFKTMMKSTTGQDVSYAEFRKLQVEQFTAEQKAKRAAAMEELMDDEPEEVEEEEVEQKSSSSSTTRKSTSGVAGISKTKTTTATTVKKKEEKLDAKQQWKKGKVSSDSFQEMRDKFVNLYSRHGDNSRLEYSHKRLFKKGASYYVEINSTYYKVEYSNWGAYNKMIIKGAGGNLYFNAHL